MTTRVRLLLTAALVCATALGLVLGSGMAEPRRSDTAAELADSVATRLLHATPRQRRAVLRDARAGAATDGESGVGTDAKGQVVTQKRKPPASPLDPAPGASRGCRIA